MTEELQTVETVDLSPFKKMVMTIGELPTSFVESMTYYECLAWLVNYLQTTIIDTINNNAEVSEELQGKYLQLVEQFNTLKDYVDTYFDDLDVQDEIDHKLDEMAASGELEEILTNYVHKLDDFSDSNQVTVGNNLLTDSSLWVTNSSWVTNNDNSFTHITGQSSDLVYNYNFEANKVYIIDFQVTSSSPANSDGSNGFTVQIGNTQPFVTYRGVASYHYVLGLKPTQSGPLKFVTIKWDDPFSSSSAFTGTISSITLKEVSNEGIEQLIIKDGNDDKSVPFSVLLDENKTIAIGEDAGVGNYSQTHNVYLGYNAGKSDVSGYFNTAIGSAALANSINTSRNIAIGRAALNLLETGDRNIAIGTFCQSHNTYGRMNLAIGFDTLNSMTYGESNIALGNMAMQATTSAAKNQIAIGTLAMSAAQPTAGQNIAIGDSSVRTVTAGANNIGIGKSSLYKITTGSNNIAIGTNSQNKNQTLTGLISIGVDSAVSVADGSSSILIGHAQNGSALTSATRSTVIGTRCLTRATSITSTILLGDNISADENHTTLNNVLVINPGKYNTVINRDNYLNIANVLFGDLTTAYQEKFGICVSNPTAYLHLAAGKAVANCAPLKFTSTNAVLLATAEDGAMEYDGTHLYFTIGSTRHTIV